MTDLRLTNARLAPSGSNIANAVRALGNFIARTISDYAAFLRGRRGFADISAMDDAQLRDIGLFRGDVITASMIPTAGDPTRYLARVSKPARDQR